MTRTPPTMPNCPEDWEKLYKKLANDLALVESEWDIDVHDLVELKLNKEDHTVVIVDKTPFAVDHALARVAAIAIAGLFHRHGGMDVYGDPAGIRLGLEDSKTCKRLVTWERALFLETDGTIMLDKGYYPALAKKLEELAQRCRERAPIAENANREEQERENNRIVAMRD